VAFLNFTQALLVQHGRNNPAVSKHSKALRRKIFAFYLLTFNFCAAALVVCSELDYSENLEKE
jgi:hypothetical protein